MPASSSFRLRQLAHHVAHLDGVAAAPLEAEHDGQVGPTPQQYEQLRDEGLTIVDNAVDPELLPRLRDAARELVALARRREEKGGFAMRHSEDAGPWGIRGIYDPAWGAASKVFTEYMMSQPVLDYAKAFLGAEPDELMLPDTDFVIFCNPPEGYTQGWHRDVRTYGDGGDWSDDAQRARWAELTGPNLFPSGQNDYTSNNGGLQLRWQLALIDTPDSGLGFVSGSHNRYRTLLEDAALGGRARGRDGIDVGENPFVHDGIAEIAPHEGSQGSTVVALKAGQTAYWNGNGMHRGFTKPGVERLSLSCAYVKWNGVKVLGGDAGRVELGGRPVDSLDKSQKINLMDPRLVWKLNPEVRESLPTEWMRTAWDRWILTQPTTYEELLEEGTWETREVTGHGRDNSSKLQTQGVPAGAEVDATSEQ